VALAGYVPVMIMNYAAVRWGSATLQAVMILDFC